MKRAATKKAPAASGRRPAASHWHCRVQAAGYDDVQRLRQWGADGRISADHLAVRDDGVHLVLSDADLEFLRAMDVAVERGDAVEVPPTLEGAAATRAARAARAPGVEADQLLTGWVSGYLGVAALLARFAALHAAFPALTQWIDLPHGTHGYDGSSVPLRGAATVKMLRITTTPGSVDKPGLLLIAGQHAREWIPPIALLELAEQLLRTYTPGSGVPEVQAVNALVDGLDILIIPAANPDGINFSHVDFALWRKNRRLPPAGSSCSGVDVNRNYDMYFAGAGSSGDACNDTYRGPAAFSEPETRNVRHVLEQFPNVLAAVDCHSFGEALFRASPTGGIAIPSQPVEPADHAIFVALEDAMNDAIETVTPGKRYATGTTNNHAGTLDDYLFLAHRVFGFTMECGQDFQPPVAQALNVVQEVAAALRALGRETLGLHARFTTPVALAQAIDRSGSMVASGYVDATRFNAKRLVDLMSLGDAASISAFNHVAHTPALLTTIDHPGRYAPLRAAIDGIAFGGTTSIGAGLQAAAASLAAATSPRAVVLLSDGYQNRAPWVADVLAGWPATTPAYTIALGPASDQALLESIALATGGRYAYAPDALGLLEVYNYVRADATGESIVLEDTRTLPPIDGFEQSWFADVDPDAAAATFVLTWDTPQVEPRFTLTPPAGPVMDTSRVRRRDTRGMRLLTLRRPQPGRWKLTVERKPGGPAVRVNVCVFLRSPLRLRLEHLHRPALRGRPLQVAAFVRWRQTPIALTKVGGSVAAPLLDPASLLAKWVGAKPTITKPWQRNPDAHAKPLLQALAIRERMLRDGAPDPLRQQTHALVPVPHNSRGIDDTGLHWTGRGADRGADRGAERSADRSDATAMALRHDGIAVPGSCTMRVRAEGRDPRTGAPFVRLGMTSIVVR